jgi:integrase
MPLTDIKIRNAKAQNKAYKLFDERGLFLLISPIGSKYWRFKYRFEGKEKLLALGIYPDVALAEARGRRDQARKQISNGIDPSVLKQTSKQAAKAIIENSFESVAREWFIKFNARWVETYSNKVINRLEQNVFPWIGHLTIGEILPTQLLNVLQRVEDRGLLETAHRILQSCSRIFRYAVATGRANHDITSGLRGAIPPAKTAHYAAITDPLKVAALLRAVNGYEGSLTTKCALRLAPLVFVRPGELRGAEWSEINLETAEWNIPTEKMKMRRPHLVPLSQQAIEILKELQPLTGNNKYVFPNERTKTRQMSENTMAAALRRMDFGSKETTVHGFRATARTLLDEVLKFRPDIIECQLAHAVRDANGRAYNRTTYLPERKEMMQKWADYLDRLANG